jgi:hypothetical protein
MMCRTIYRQAHDLLADVPFTTTHSDFNILQGPVKTYITSHIIHYKSLQAQGILINLIIDIIKSQIAITIDIQ